jgi:hypothetical protein
MDAAVISFAWRRSSKKIRVISSPTARSSRGRRLAREIETRVATSLSENLEDVG